MRVLLVEDEPQMAALLGSALGKQDMVVDHVPSLALAEAAADSRAHDIVLLDRKLPDGDGLSLIPALRRACPGVPIIVLSALGSLDNRLAGLDTGADDYLAKPFSVDELLARMRAVLRRPASIASNTVTVGALQFDLADRSVRIGGEPVDLPRRELLALETLIRRAGRIVARNALEEAVYGFDDDIASNTLDSHISRLRKKLAPAGVQILAMRGLGYIIKAGS